LANHFTDHKIQKVNLTERGGSFNPIRPAPSLNNACINIVHILSITCWLYVRLRPEVSDSSHPIISVRDRRAWIFVRLWSV